MDDSKKTKKQLLDEIALLKAQLKKDSYSNSVSNNSFLKTDQDRYKQIFETNQAVKLIVDPETGLIIQANKAACQFYGYSPNDLVQKKISEINTLSEKEIKKEMDLAKNEKKRFFNFQHRLASGEIRDVEVYSAPFEEEGRTLLYSIIHDVTGKIQSTNIQNVLLNISKATGESDSLEELLGVIHEQVGSLIDATNFYVAIYDKQSKEYSFPYFVDEYDKGDDFTQEEMYKSLTEYVRLRNLPMLIDEELCNKLTAEGKLNLIGRSSLQWMGVPFMIDKNINGIVVCQSYLPSTSYSNRDLELMSFVSEHIAWAIGRKKAEEAIKASEESYKGLFDNATDAIYILDKNGLFLDVNTSTLKMFGYSYDYFIGKTLKNLSASGENDLNKVKSQIAAAYNGKSQIFEFYGISKNKEVLITEVHLNASVYFGQKVVIANAHEITRRKIAQRKMEKSEQRFRTLIEKSPVAISLSRNGKILFVNQAFLDVFKVKSENDIIGNSIFDNIAESERAKVTKRNKNRESGKKEISSYETIGFRGDGTMFPFHINATLFELDSGPSTLSFITDISDLKQAQDERIKLERQILQTQKLESLGVLAGGIAHDFNNLLTGIMGNTGLALMHTDDKPVIKNNLYKIEHIAARAAELCNQMLAYSGKGQFVVQTLDLNEVIRDMVLLLNVSIPKKVELEVHLDDSITAIEADVTQVRQIIMNLITNAADAMEGKAGKITLSSRQETFNKDHLVTPYLDSEYKNGIYVVFEVNDNGCGMTEETKEKLFDPFFTTKFTGRGLGLAAVLGIVRGHGGSLKIDSIPGKGTQVKVILPISTKKLEPKHKKKTLPKELLGSGTILVVDDEEAVRVIVKDALEYSGFNVLLAEDGLQALRIYKDNFKKIELVLLDLTMPKLNGVETYKRLVTINPDVKVILSSGFNEQDSIERLSNDKKIAYLQKPYHLQILKDKIMHELEDLAISVDLD